MKISLITTEDKDFKNDLDKYLDGVTGIVEANSFEQLMLWRETHEQRGLPWEGSRMGLFCGVGELAGMQISLQMQSVFVNGQKILFIESPSQVVDHRQIDAWLEAHMPKTAKRPDGYLNKTDANNFHNVLHR